MTKIELHPLEGFELFEDLSGTVSSAVARGKLCGWATIRVDTSDLMVVGRTASMTILAGAHHAAC